MKYSYSILNFIIIIVLIIGFNLFYSFTKKSSKFGFKNYYTNNWTSDLIKRFNIYQSTMNPNNQFNLQQLQKQVTPKEVEEYLKTGVWYWPDDLKTLYIQHVLSSPIIKIDAQHALNYAMKLYNQTAIRELLAWNTKEGHFLLYGGDIGVSDGMPTNTHNTIKCSNSIDNSQLKKKVYTGFNLWNGYINTTTNVIKQEDIPKEMPGFSFVKGPCNPCVALNSPSDFSCPFSLNVKGDNSISETWKQLWKL
jgi:hypothetical protein